MEAGDKLAATLTAEQWNAVLNILNDAPAPHRITAPLIQALMQQLQPRPNGATMAPDMPDHPA